MRPERELDPNRLPEHVDRLYRAAWAICGSREQAEDLVQDTFLRVLGRRRLLHSENDVGYLLRTLRNTYLDQRRSEMRRPQVEPLDEKLAVSEDGATALEARAVYGAIAALPAGCRDALVAVDVLGLSYREAARALRTREAALTSRLYRGREQVARRLRGEQVVPQVVRRALQPVRVGRARARQVQQHPHAVAAEHAGVPAP
jgi:RNA polymerase sigma-70 factor, ECF subfamily